MASHPRLTPHLICVTLVCIMLHLYYCRHGLSVMNAAGKLSGRTDTPLTSQGREQARIAGRTAPVKFDLIVASPLIRARETAEIIAAEIGYPRDEIIFDHRAVERDFGELEGADWHPNMDLSDIETVEPFVDIIARAKSLKEWLDARSETTILLVSHGAFIRAIRSLYLPDMSYADATQVMPNAVIIQIV